MVESELEGSSHLRQKVLKGMSIGLGSLAAILAVANIYFLSLYSLALMEAGYAIYSWYVYRQIKANTLHHLHKYIVTGFVTFMVVFGTTINLLHSAAFAWTLVMPIIYYLLLGRKIGVVATILLLLVQLVNIHYLFELEPHFMHLDLMINLGFSYLSIAAIAHVYESNRYNTELKLTKLALVDPLTQANNRLALKRRFAKLDKLTKPFHLMVLDIDHFKSINDKYGHDAGDMVLQLTTQLLISHVGEENVYRQGGEEFCIVLENCAQSDAIVMADKIRTAVDNMKVSFQNKSFNVTVSIGVAHSSEKLSVEAINRAADENLYKAKSYGRNLVVAV